MVTAQLDQIIEIDTRLVEVEGSGATPGDTVIGYLFVDTGLVRAETIVDSCGDFLLNFLIQGRPRPRLVGTDCVYGRLIVGGQLSSIN